ncbi:cytidylate kinase family protein [Candidatus Woesearchaeota archaeon]|nr:cytidylate kinase family protein [Candidatus Woesearchaeota archaeon]
MRITISGTPGSGKSTIGKMLAKKLGLKFYSVGDLRGKMAMDMGLTIDELNRLGENDFSTDKKADEYQKELGLNEDDFVIDSRLGFHFIPDSIKIFLDCDQDVAAQRIYLEPRMDEKTYHNIKEAKEAIKKRIESDKKRYLQYYALDPFKKEFYDIFIDTSSAKPEEIVDIILRNISRK